MTLTKQDIDGMVYRLWQKGWGRSDQDLTDLQRDAYLAAGLTAEGAWKPERVVGTLFEDHEGRLAFRKDGEWIHAYSVPVHGTFVPDGAE